MVALEPQLVLLVLLLYDYIHHGIKPKEIPTDLWENANSN